MALPLSSSSPSSSFNKRDSYYSNLSNPRSSIPSAPSTSQIQIVPRTPRNRIIPSLDDSDWFDESDIDNNGDAELDTPTGKRKTWPRRNQIVASSASRPARFSVTEMPGILDSFQDFSHLAGLSPIRTTMLEEIRVLSREARRKQGQTSTKRRAKPIGKTTAKAGPPPGPRTSSRGRLYGNLNELALQLSTENPDKAPRYQRTMPEEDRIRAQEEADDGDDDDDDDIEAADPPPDIAHPGLHPLESPNPVVSPRPDVSQFATQLYTISYLIFFSILGTLARLGLQWLTFYPGAPVVLSALWANFAGSVFMGFLLEDRRLFRDEWGRFGSSFNSLEKSSADAIDEHKEVKRTIPLYIGLATGFCGSLTSFSSFMEDMFLSLSNNLPTPSNHPYPAGFLLPLASSSVHRNAGYSFLSVLAVPILSICLCLSAIKIGAHLSEYLDPVTPTFSFFLIRKIFDRVVVAVAWLGWLGVVFMTIWPPDRPGGPSRGDSWAAESWRGDALLACVFAPIGCLLRFFISIRLNDVSASFPLGTFAVNTFGSAILALAFDLQHVRLGSGSNAIAGGSLISCQVLRGIMDGFCGCLTTVSTWVAELNHLHRGHAYAYGSASLASGMGLMLIIMGSVRWSIGWQDAIC